MGILSFINRFLTIAFNQGKAALLMENIREEDTPMLYLNEAKPESGDSPLIVAQGILS